jgi:hypothetical protein
MTASPDVREEWRHVVSSPYRLDDQSILTRKHEQHISPLLMIVHDSMQVLLLSWRAVIIEAPQKSRWLASVARPTSVQRGTPRFTPHFW